MVEDVVQRDVQLGGRLGGGGAGGGIGGDHLAIEQQLAVGGMVAELLDMPYVSLATKFELSGNKATVNREIEGGEEACEVQLPLVVSCAKGVAEQRIPNMRGIMAARTKPLKVVEPANVNALTSIQNFDLPPAKAGVKLVSPDNVEELVRLLHEEAKVI